MWTDVPQTLPFYTDDFVYFILKTGNQTISTFREMTGLKQQGPAEMEIVYPLNKLSDKSRICERHLMLLLQCS